MITVVVTSPRIPAGSLRREAWAALSAAGTVFALRDDAHVEAIRAAGVPVTVGDLSPVEGTEDERGSIVVLACADHDDPAGLAARLRAAGRAVQLVEPSPDLPGARLLDAVAVMDRLRTGCPWDREQTHASLAKYLVEEAYETLEAIDSGNPAHLCEELGDVLLQVLFHARVAQDGPQPFGIDDVASGYVEKMTRRHPHVFGDVHAADAGAVEANWESIKAAEKAHRTHPLDGVPPMPPLERAEKYASRLEKSGHGDAARRLAEEPAANDAERIGRDLLGLVLEAREAGVDPSAALRDTLARLRDGI